MAPDLLPALTASVDGLAQIRLDTLSLTDVQSLGAGIVLARNRLDGIWSRVLGELQTRGQGKVPTADGPVPTTAWVRDTAAVSGTSAGRTIRSSVALRELPAIAEAIIDGTITVAHGHILARLVGRIDPQSLLDSQAELIDIARRTDPDQLAHHIRHLIATWCPPQLEREETDAINNRFLQLTRKHNGRTRGVFELPYADAELLLTVLEPLARRDTLDDTRTAGQRRADALTDVFTLALRHSDLPDAGGHRPTLTYVIGTDPRPDTFTLDPDRPAGQHCPSAPWTGPATQATIDQLLCDSRTGERVAVPVQPSARDASVSERTHASAALG